MKYRLQYSLSCYATMNNTQRTHPPNPQSYCLKLLTGVLLVHVQHHPRLLAIETALERKEEASEKAVKRALSLRLLLCYVYASLLYGPFVFIWQ